MKCKANKTGCRKEFAVLDVKRKRRNIELVTVYEGATASNL
jgi:hypothetical protein